MRHASTSPRPLISSQAYDLLKFVTTLLLPSVGTLYFALAQLWGLPYAEQVVGTIAAVNACLGALVGISTKSYNKSDAKYGGDITVTESETGKTYSIALNGGPEDLDIADEVTFKILR